VKVKKLEGEVSLVEEGRVGIKFLSDRTPDKAGLIVGDPADEKFSGLAVGDKVLLTFAGPKYPHTLVKVEKR
jgi:hypothetical protein